MRNKTLGILGIWKIFSISVVVSLSACAYGRGARPPAEVKLYVIFPDDSYCLPVEPWCQGQNGLVRKQDKEVKPFGLSKGMYALSSEDLQIIISRCPQPK